MTQPQPKPYNIKRCRPLYAIFKAVIMRPSYHKPKKISMLCDIEEPAIFVSNHDAKRSPVMADLYFPVKTVKWGAYQMLCGYNTRREYLRDTFYTKKQGYGRKLASFKAFFEAFFSLFIYRGMKFLPTYPDARLTKTLGASIDAINDGFSVFIFPEDSDGGYKEVMEKFFPGFVMLAEAYFRKTGKDLPIYPVYYHSGYKKLVVGSPRYAHKLKQDGYNRNAIADVLRDDVNALYYNYIKKD